MAKRKAKRNIKRPSEDIASECSNNDEKEEEERNKLIDQEVERRIAASKAIRDAETEHLLTGLHLLRSNFSNEQLQTPMQQFLEQNMPNLALKMGDKDGEFEVDWKDNDKDENLPVSHANETDMHQSLLHQLSKAYPGMPSNAVNTTDLLGSTEFQYPDFAMNELSQFQDIGFQNTFHTPGANSQRLSVGMTPKTLRLPKPGEILLSVRGSPLGVFKDDDNMEAIKETEEGQVD
ncbi:hypothetical protein ACHQM5_002048 [Ranunculus cassubicifolius]